MDIKEALEIILDLALDNMLENDHILEGQHRDILKLQEEAYLLVDTLRKQYE